MSEQDDLEFSELIRNAMPDRVISNFVAVCEVLTETGVELQVLTSQSITPWLATGMLQSAVNTLQGAEDIYIFSDEEEFEDDE
jgi:hypothetical protein